MLMLGREVRIPAELRSGRVEDSEYLSIRILWYVSWLGERLHMAHDIAREHLGNAAKRHRYAYDTKLEHLRYEQGKCVRYLHQKREIGTNTKLQPRYVLCIVLKRLSDVTYLFGVEKGDNRVVHHDNLKRYEGQSRPKWMDRAVRSFVRGN